MTVWLQNLQNQYDNNNYLSFNRIFLQLSCPVVIFFRIDWRIDSVGQAPPTANAQNRAQDAEVSNFGHLNFEFVSDLGISI